MPGSIPKYLSKLLEDLSESDRTDAAKDAGQILERFGPADRQAAARDMEAGLKSVKPAHRADELRLLNEMQMSGRTSWVTVWRTKTIARRWVETNEQRATQVLEHIEVESRPEAMKKLRETMEVRVSVWLPTGKTFPSPDTEQDKRWHRALKEGFDEWARGYSPECLAAWITEHEGGGRAELELQVIAQLGGREELERADKDMLEQADQHARSICGHLKGRYPSIPLVPVGGTTPVIGLRAIRDWCKAVTSKLEAREQAARLKGPSERAFQAYRLKVLTGLKTQKEIAARMTKETGRKVHQGQVSKWLKSVDAWIKGGNVLPDVPHLNGEPKSVDPRLIGMGRRQNGLAKRQRERLKPESED